MKKIVSLAVVLLLAVLFTGSAKAQNVAEHSLENGPQSTHWYGNIYEGMSGFTRRSYTSARYTGLGPKPRASCGWYMRGVFGGKYGPDFNRAYAWARLPRVAPRPGAVVVSSRKGRGCGGPCGHVVKIVNVIDACRAIVRDNKGTYERNICRNRVAVVQP